MTYSVFLVKLLNAYTINHKPILTESISWLIASL